MKIDDLAKEFLLKLMEENKEKENPNSLYIEVEGEEIGLELINKDVLVDQEDLVDEIENGVSIIYKNLDSKEKSDHLVLTYDTDEENLLLLVKDHHCCHGHHHHEEGHECCHGHHHHEEGEEHECCHGHHHENEEGHECCHGHHHHDEECGCHSKDGCCSDEE